MTSGPTPNPTPAPTGPRDYTRLLRSAPRGLQRDAAMRWVVDALWEAFHHDRLSWIGFYTKTPGRDEMVLTCRRDKPACSPIGLHGMCGRGWKDRRPIVIDDVATLGAGYIACDPRDRSEAVIPLFEQDGTCWGVLDADSYDLAGFNDHDARQMTLLVEAAGLSEPGRAAGGVLRL